MKWNPLYWLIYSIAWATEEITLILDEVDEARRKPKGG